MSDTHEDDKLPITGYDGLRAGDIDHRVRSLTSEELRQVLRYEEAHARRPRVLAALRARLSGLAAGAEPSPGGAAPGEPPAGRRGSPVTPSTVAEPASAPPHGTPDQRGKPKGDRRG